MQVIVLLMILLLKVILFDKLKSMDLLSVSVMIATIFVFGN